MNGIQKEKEVLVTPLFYESDTNPIGDLRHHSIEISDRSTKEISTMNQEFEGFIQIPRSILKHPAYKAFSPKQKVALQKIIELAIYTKDPHKVYISNDVVLIHRNQVFHSLRYIVDACNDGIRLSQHRVSKNDVEKILKIFLLHELVRQEVRHDRLLLTLSFLDESDKKNYSSKTASQTEVRQKLDRSQTNKNKENKYKKEKEDKYAEAENDALPLANAKAVLSLFFCFSSFRFHGISQHLLDLWKKAYPHCNIAHQIAQMEAWCIANKSAASKKKNWIKFINDWLLKNNNHLEHKKAYQDQNKSFSQGVDRRQKNLDGTFIDNPLRGVF